MEKFGQRSKTRFDIDLNSPHSVNDELLEYSNERLNIGISSPTETFLPTSHKSII